MSRKINCALNNKHRVATKDLGCFLLLLYFSFCFILFVILVAFGFFLIMPCVTPAIKITNFINQNPSNDSKKLDHWQNKKKLVSPTFFRSCSLGAASRSSCTMEPQILRVQAVMLLRAPKKKNGNPNKNGSFRGSV